MAVSDLVNRGGAPHRTCATCYELDRMDDAKSAVLLDLLANPLVKYTELAAELASDPDWLLEISSDALSRHARGRCGARVKLRGAGS